MANTINNYSVTPINQMQSNTPTIVSDSLNYLFQVCKYPFPDINMTPVTNKEIKDIIKSFKWRNSHGYDEISQNILKISMPFILSLLTYICNKSPSLSIFPTRPKYSRISPIFKKEIRQKWLIIGQYLYWYPFQKFLKSYF
jgi:hypothetical protein